jgi:hypothetical protein
MQPATVVTPRKRGPRVVPFLLGLVAALAISAVVGAFRGDSSSGVDAQLAALKKESAEARDRIRALEADLAAKDTQLAAAQQPNPRIAELEAQVGSLSQQLAALKKVPPPQQFTTLVDGLANDRLLLVEMRKDLPENRTDARRYWQGIKDTSVRSNPSLGPLADKVLNAIPAYYSWKERSYPSEEDKQLNYVLTGASVYDTASRDFWNAVLKTAIDRIDAVVMTAPQ